MNKNTYLIVITKYVAKLIKLDCNFLIYHHILTKKKRGDIRKRLYDIEKTQKVDRKLKNKLLKELDSISTELKFVQRPMISDYRDENYADIEDIEYIFGDIDNYYAPLLTSSPFDKGYQRYHFRGDKKCNMSVENILIKFYHI